MITGEPVAVEKHPGDRVLAGTIAKQGTFRFRATEVGQKTMLAHIIKMVQEAQGSKAPVQRTVDRIALIFVPSVVGISLLTFLLWLLIGGTAHLPQAILSAVSVLVIACPCAMGLATPTALMVGIGKAAEKNILIKDATALEEIRKTDALVIDKTGTLTIPNDTGEVLKPHAREAMEQLSREGIEVWMCSGDKDERAKTVAQEAAIPHYKSQVLPQDKEDLVRLLQHQGHHVAMVGDGINDSQALAAADVSIAMGKGTDVAMEVAQVTLMGTDLRRIPDAIGLSKRTVGMIRQNLFWAFIYNVVCIPLAAGLPYLFGLSWQITPMWASALMAFSSVSVVLNSLRLKLS
jgi:Cu2+-exporting ATPase